MSLIYPKNTNLPSRLHCKPIPYIPEIIETKNDKNDKKNKNSKNKSKKQSKEAENNNTKINKVSWRLSEDDDMFVVSIIFNYTFISHFYFFSFSIMQFDSYEPPPHSLP